MFSWFRHPTESAEERERREVSEERERREVSEEMMKLWRESEYKIWKTFEILYADKDKDKKEDL